MTRLALALLLFVLLAAGAEAWPTRPPMPGPEPPGQYAARLVVVGRTWR